MKVTQQTTYSTDSGRVLIRTDFEDQETLGPYHIVPAGCTLEEIEELALACIAVVRTYNASDELLARFQMKVMHAIGKPS